MPVVSFQPGQPGQVDVREVTDRTNRLLRELEMPAHPISVQELQGTASSMFIAAFERLFNVTVPGVKRYPRKRSEYIHNANLVICAMEATTQLDLSHITGEGICTDNLYEISEFVRVFQAVVDMLKVGEVSASVGDAVRQHMAEQALAQTATVEGSRTVSSSSATGRSRRSAAAHASASRENPITSPLRTSGPRTRTGRRGSGPPRETDDDDAELARLRREADALRSQRRLERRAGRRLDSRRRPRSAPRRRPRKHAPAPPAERARPRPGAAATAMTARRRGASEAASGGMLRDGSTLSFGGEDLSDILDAEEGRVRGDGRGRAAEVVAVAAGADGESEEEEKLLQQLSRDAGLGRVTEVEGDSGGRGPAATGRESVAEGSREDARADGRGLRVAAEDGGSEDGDGPALQSSSRSARGGDVVSGGRAAGRRRGSHARRVGRRGGAALGGERVAGERVAGEYKIEDDGDGDGDGGERDEDAFAGAIEAMAADFPALYQQLRKAARVRRLNAKRDARSRRAQARRSGASTEGAARRLEAEYRRMLAERVRDLDRADRAAARAETARHAAERHAGAANAARRDRLEEALARQTASRRAGRASRGRQMMLRMFQRSLRLERETLREERARRVTGEAGARERAARRAEEVEVFFTERRAMVRERTRREREERRMAERAQEDSIRGLLKSLREERAREEQQLLWNLQHEQDKTDFAVLDPARFDDRVEQTLRSESFLGRDVPVRPAASKAAAERARLRRLRKAYLQ